MVYAEGNVPENIRSSRKGHWKFRKPGRGFSSAQILKRESIKLDWNLKRWEGKIETKQTYVAVMDILRSNI